MPDAKGFLYIVGIVSPAPHSRKRRPRPRRSRMPMLVGRLHTYIKLVGELIRGKKSSEPG